MELDYFSPYTCKIQGTVPTNYIKKSRISNPFFFEELRWTNTNKSYLCNRIKLKVESEKGSIQFHIF